VTAIVLFTRDLRVHDQPVLAAAARTSSHVVPLFVLDEALLRREGTPSRLSFLLDSLADLKESLRALGADLVVRRGDTVEQTLRVARAVGADRVFIGTDASPYAQRREAQLELACRRERLELRTENATAVVPPGKLTPSERDHYRVFTPYWRRWRELPVRPAHERPARLALPVGVEPAALPVLADLARGRPSPTLPSGGERIGRRLMARTIADGLRDYELRRDDLAAQGTSRLSPYLHFGCVSATELVSGARLHGEHAEPFVRQLCWRDFFLQLLAANPRTATEDLHARRGEWVDDDEALARWRAGETGYGVVDAAMRQLNAEGWLPNRARLIVASFLTRTLGIDWRRGAAVFADLLVDADVASNVGNWQWVAGTGVDTRASRGFNLAAQARRFDPAGAYVARYVPELAVRAPPPPALRETAA
jgi:deoxyribodipyrimidine photo-lyase